MHAPPPDDGPDPTDDDAPNAPPRRLRVATTVATDVPTSAEPLRGLLHLGPLALLGRQRILALGAAQVAYVWDQIAVQGTVVLIAGPPAEGKTTLLFLILACRLTREAPVALLGRLVTPAPVGTWVVLIEGEHSEGSTSRKLTKSLRTLGIDDGALDRIIIVARKAVRLGSPEWNDVERMVAQGIVSDIGIDTVARVAPADANDEREQVAIFDAVAQAIERAPAPGNAPTVWAVSHTRKGDRTATLADVSGSVQRVGQADSVLLVAGEKVGGRTVSTTVTFAKLREDPDNYPLPMTFSLQADATGTPLLDVTDATVASQRDKGSLEREITHLLREGPSTSNNLASRLGRSGTDIEAALTNLFAARAIQSTTLRVRGRDRKAFARHPGGAGTTSGLARAADAPFVDETSPDSTPDPAFHPTRPDGHPTK
jgi:hypothetical protein